MAEDNGKKTVSLALYVATLVLALIINAVAVTTAILLRPTREEVKTMITDQFQEKSYLGQKLANIEEKINNVELQLDEHKILTEKKK